MCAVNPVLGLGSLDPATHGEIMFRIVLTKGAFLVRVLEYKHQKSPGNPQGILSNVSVPVIGCLILLLHLFRPIDNTLLTPP
jgi:hypothetical protein